MLLFNVFLILVLSFFFVLPLHISDYSHLSDYHNIGLVVTLSKNGSNSSLNDIINISSLASGKINERPYHEDQHPTFHQSGGRNPQTRWSQMLSEEHLPIVEEQKWSGTQNALMTDNNNNTNFTFGFACSSPL